MLLTRREALTAMAGATLAAFVLPAPRPRIDLRAFCARRDWGKYDLRLPYELHDYTYATDAVACLRVRPERGDTVQHHGRMPPFHGLPWNHDRLTGWRTLPEREPIPAAHSDCPRCDGSGYMGDVVAADCPKCEGRGQVWDGSGYGPIYPQQCPTCNGVGQQVPAHAVLCPNCQGNAIGTFPALVEWRGCYFDARHYQMVQRLGVEVVHGDWLSDSKYPLLTFRCHQDGVGLMLGVNKNNATQRIREARAT